MLPTIAAIILFSYNMQSTYTIFMIWLLPKREYSNLLAIIVLIVKCFDHFPKDFFIDPPNRKNMFIFRVYRVMNKITC